MLGFQMMTRVHSLSLQSVCFESDMLLLPPTSSWLSIGRTAGSFLNGRKYSIRMLNDQKTIETRLFEKTELGKPAP